MINMKVIYFFLLVTQSAFAATVTIECRGEGPSLDIARQDADRICLNSMATRLDSEIKVQNLSVETERETAFHSEITRTGSYEGLTCVPSNEKITQLADQVLVNFTCRYDLALVKRMPGTYNRMPKTYNKEVVSLATVPYCESLLVRGETPRVIQCLSNPVRLVLKPGDESVTVRAKNSLPKTVQRGDIHESTTVYLDPAR